MTQSFFDQKAYKHKVEKNYRWNFGVNVLDTTFFFFGMSFIAASTVIPVYVSRLTDSILLIGLSSAIAAGGWFLPQLLTANLTERLPRKKPFVVRGGFLVERLPVLLLAVSTFVFARSTPTIALVFFFLFYTWNRLGSGALAPAWEDMIAKIIPLERRGRFFGIANFGGALLGIAGARLTTLFLARYPFPINFGWCMASAAGAMFLSWGCLALTREPARPATKEHVSHINYLKQLPDLLRRDRNFRSYLISRAISGLGYMAAGLTAVYAVQRWELPDEQAGVFTTVLLVVQMIAHLAFGYLGDRYGHKRSLQWGMLAWAAGMLVALFAPSPDWFYLAFAAAGISSSAELVAGLMIVLEFSAPEDRPTYVGLGNTTKGIFYGLAPVIGGGLASLVGYRPVFVLAFLLTMAAWGWLTWRVEEPRHQNGHLTSELE
jgi:MFS family permease